MGNTTRLRNMLYKKIMAEHTTFIENLRQQTPNQILDRAYEKVVKDDLLMVFENDTDLCAKQLQLLYNLKSPLETLYQGWLKTDDTHMEDLRDSINTTTQKIHKGMTHERVPNKSAGRER